MGEMNKWPQGMVEINILFTKEVEINVLQVQKLTGYWVTGSKHILRNDTPTTMSFNKL